MIMVKEDADVSEFIQERLEAGHRRRKRRIEMGGFSFDSPAKVRMTKARSRS